MPRLTKKTIAVLVGVAVTALATGVGLYLQSSPIGTWVEQRTYDLRFAYRGPLPVSTEVPITILAIDETSLTNLPEPIMLWHGHFAAVVEKLAATGAVVLGIDFVFSDISAFDPEETQRRFSAALIGAGVSNMPIVFANPYDYIPPEAIRFAALAVGHSFGYANLTTDTDDFVRRQEIAAPGGISFALDIARRFSEKTGRNVTIDPEETSTILINYRGPDHYTRVSLSDAVEAANRNDLDFFESNFSGRIVLIGRIGERGGEDFHSTPQYYLIDRSNREIPWRTPGVEIHAHTVTTLIEGNAIEEMSTRDRQLTTLGVAAAVTLACMVLAPAWGATLSFALIAGIIGLAFVVLFPTDYWLHLVSPVSAGIVALGSSQMANYVLEGREKRYLRNAFKRYVNNDVIAKILDSPEGLILTGEERNVSILFADIRGFTSMSEGIPAATLVKLLNRYLGSMVHAIQSNGGMIDKFIGDGIMALFGATLDDEDAALHSVQAALAMLAGLDDVNRELVADGLPPIGIGVGIHSGQAVIGNIGSSERMEYTAIGGVVNTAARIESLTRKYDADILISAETFAAVGNDIEAEFLGSSEVKGKAKPIKIYRVKPK